MFAAISPEPANLEASPSLCPQFHRGQIDFDSVRTDRQTSTDSARWIGQAPRRPWIQPTFLILTPPLFPASLPPAYGNKLSPSRTMQGRGLDLYFSLLISPIFPLSCLLVSNWPHRATGEASVHQAKPEQNRLCAVRIFKINVMDISLRKRIFCLSFMHVHSFLYITGDHMSPQKEIDFALHQNDNVKDFHIEV